MRIIAGEFKGRRIRSPRGSETRPTADHVRESVFNMLQTRVTLEQARVLDLFCGTGAFGLEAISRGAAHAVFVDLNQSAVATATENARSLGVLDRCRFIRRDAIRFLRKPLGEPFDVVFADPQYAYDGIRSIPPLVERVLTESGLFVLEHDSTVGFESSGQKVESRSYGRTIVSIFRPSTQSQANESRME